MIAEPLPAGAEAEKPTDRPRRLTRRSEHPLCAARTCTCHTYAARRSAGYLRTGRGPAAVAERDRTLARGAPDRCSYVCQGLSRFRFSAVRPGDLLGCWVRTRQG